MAQSFEYFEDSVPIPKAAGYEPVVAMAEGRQYWQVNLGSRYAVEAVARYFLHGDTRVFSQAGPTYDTISELTDMHEWAPGSVAVFTRVDEHGDEVAMVLATRSQDAAK